uniref:Uncharacterized protein n=1 Tax=Noctiluca scintillans TaxID=2966 RepID=A0A7S1APR3_NOCSC|mmetsp:Transcript_54102/g.144626  ORF Transcript_54102/g.144626 Transcript_54102/m.144626 type:complete len:254 (+) Transcript_54102:102-863(+)
MFESSVGSADASQGSRCRCSTSSDEADREKELAVSRPILPLLQESVWTDPSSHSECSPTSDDSNLRSKLRANGDAVLAAVHDKRRTEKRRAKTRPKPAWLFPQGSDSVGEPRFTKPALDLVVPPSTDECSRHTEFDAGAAGSPLRRPPPLATSPVSPWARTQRETQSLLSTEAPSPVRGRMGAPLYTGESKIDTFLPAHVWPAGGDRVSELMFPLPFASQSDLPLKVDVDCLVSPGLKQTGQASSNYLVACVM